MLVFKQIIVFIILLILFAIKTNSQSGIQNQFGNDSTKAKLERCIELALEFYPDHKVYELYLKTAEEELSQTKMSWLNSFTLNWRYYPASEDETRSSLLPSLGVGLSVNIGSILATPSKVTEAEQSVKIAENSIASKRNYLIAEVKRRFFRYLQNLEMLGVHSQSLDNAEMMYELITHKYENGEVGLEEYTKYSGLFQDARENFVKSRGDYMWAKSSLEELIGYEAEAL